MLAMEEKNDINEMTEILKKVDATGMMLLMSNATVLAAHQELIRKQSCEEKETISM